MIKATILATQASLYLPYQKGVHMSTLGVQVCKISTISTSKIFWSHCTMYLIFLVRWSHQADDQCQNSGNPSSPLPPIPKGCAYGHPWHPSMQVIYNYNFKNILVPLYYVPYILRRETSSGWWSKPQFRWPKRETPQSTYNGPAEIEFVIIRESRRKMVLPPKKFLISFCFYLVGL